MKDPGSYANPINSSFQKFRTTSTQQFIAPTAPAGITSPNIGVAKYPPVCGGYFVLSKQNGFFSCL